MADYGRRARGSGNAGDRAAQWAHARYRRRDRGDQYEACSLFLPRSRYACFRSMSRDRDKALNRPRPRDQAEFSLLTLKGCSEQTRTRSRLSHSSARRNNSTTVRLRRTGRGTSGIHARGGVHDHQARGGNAAPAAYQHDALADFCSSGNSDLGDGRAAARRRAGSGASATDQSAPLAEVTVTGSRIARQPRPGGAEPDHHVSARTRSRTPARRARVGRSTRAAVRAVAIRSSPPVIQSSPTISSGRGTLNLRGLGPNRNLVLIDGRRGAAGQRDNWRSIINTIPTLAIQSVEIITGGASAVYGPDAIAGVVNFVLKKNFQGLDVDVQRGQTQHGGRCRDRDQRADGHERHGRQGQHHDRRRMRPSAIRSCQADREFYVNGWLDPNNPSGGFLVPPGYAPTAGNQPTQAALNSLFPQLPAGKVGPGTQIDFNADDTPFIQARRPGLQRPAASPWRRAATQAIKVLGRATASWIRLSPAAVSPPRWSGTRSSGAAHSTSRTTSARTPNSTTATSKRRAWRRAMPPAITIWQAHRFRAITLRAAPRTQPGCRRRCSPCSIRAPNPNAPPEPARGRMQLDLYENTNYEGPITVDDPRTSGRHWWA